MTIRGKKEFLIALIVVTSSTLILLGLLFYKHVAVGQYWPGIVMLVAAWTVCAFVFIRDYMTFYTVDTTGITEHCFKRLRTIRWSDCCFINRITVRGMIYSSASQEVIICSRHSLPVEIDDRKLSKYHWPKNETIIIQNAKDDVYYEFLKWCGGERDIRS